MILHHSPNQSSASLVYPDGRGNHAARPQVQRELSRSPPGHGQVPQICISPQEELGRKLRHQSPNPRNYSSELGHDRRSSRSPLPSRCQQVERVEDKNSRDKNRNSLRNQQRMDKSEKCFRKSRHFDLSASAPESSFQQMKETRGHRLYSTPLGNLLHVPQPQQFLPSECYLKEDRNDTKTRRCASYKDLSSFDSALILQDLPPKSKPGIVNSLKVLVQILGLSPRTSPCQSPSSSRSPSPGSSSVGSPFSPISDWPI